MDWRLELSSEFDGDGRCGHGRQSYIVDLLHGEPQCATANMVRKAAKKRPSKKCPKANKPPTGKRTKVADISVDG